MNPNNWRHLGQKWPPKHQFNQNYCEWRNPAPVGRWFLPLFMEFSNLLDFSIQHPYLSRAVRHEGVNLGWPQGRPYMTRIPGRGGRKKFRVEKEVETNGISSNLGALSVIEPRFVLFSSSRQTEFQA